MSYLVNNIRRFARELATHPQEIPKRIGGALKVKLATGTHELLAATGAGKVVGARYRGRGIALMFHEIHEDVEAGLRMGCSPGQLRRALAAMRAQRRDFVTPDEALARLADPEARDFVVLTFDDAYRDNRILALPILEEFGAPMTLFTPTGMVTREIYAWWLGLRALFLQNEAVDIEAMGQRLVCGDGPSRNAALRHVTTWIGTDLDRAEALKATFARYGLSLPQLVAEVAMDETELRAFAAHPLVTIGGHTTTHRFLSRLDDDTARRDIADNKAWLENLLQKTVRHFAYPYGSAGACGAREAGFVREAGFASAYSTRTGHLFPDHLKTPYLLPREDAGAHQSAAQLKNRLSGVNRALATGFGNPIAGLI
ncbi:polysaccharide deacetylase family protein [Rhizobium sp. RU36D]|uniref:polysaccharide deacetylase family protein n=1 Tax=Rhizobium sp. RU36D TaxID=1907415 RepID=UPI0009D7AD0A|nr:polysaccharide deacetylase family protein [Rhizobium sp. RU36D]SMC39263.1 Peptidoglycan/xylan/chitin deacetylase, PgdA/CDA1 family [Rhizobium sp. RU36D]